MNKQQIQEEINNLWTRKIEINQEIDRIKQKEIDYLVEERIKISQRIEELFLMKREIEGDDSSFYRTQ